jgi:hypothetical protein
VLFPHFIGNLIRQREGHFDSIVGAGLAPCRSSGPFLSDSEERLGSLPANAKAR